MQATKLIGLVLGAALALSGQVMANTYKIDTKGQHAFVHFKVSHLGYSYIVGRFNDFTGEFRHDMQNPGASKVNVTIDARSIDTNHAERDKHLRSDDFFNVDSHPTITFESTGFEVASNGHKLTGNLTIQGITRPVTIDVTHVGEGKDPWGGYRSGFHGQTVVKASEFGMPDWVGDVEIELNIEGIRE